MIKTAILLSTLLALSTSAFAESSYDKLVEKDTDLELIVMYAEERAYELDEVSLEIGRIYDKAGITASYTKVLDINFKKDIPHIAVGNIKIGTNGSLLAEAEAKATFAPFFYEDSLLSSLGVISFVRGGTFGTDVSKSKTISDGWDTKTINYDSKERFSKGIAGVGFSIRDTLWLSGTTAEVTYGRGLVGDVKGEAELRIATPFYRFRDFETSLEIGLKNTITDDYDFNSASLKLNITF